MVSFGPLGPEAVHQIAKLELTSASRREALERRKLHLRWSEEVVSFLAKREYDTLYGARPLKRLFDIQVMAPLARFW